ncbi:MAG: sulfotransferase family protein [Acidimicrobiales bacterium]
MLPNLIVIGAQKCGTSTLHSLLGQHPQICMSTVKELNFFTWHWERGLDWYASQFDDAPVRGEATPEYTMQPGWPEVPARMAASVPDARLVYLTRDPVERIASQWMHATASGVWNASFEDTVRDPGFPDSNFVVRSRYWSQEAAYLRHFAEEQLLVASMDQLVSDTEATLARILAHVGLDPAGARDLHLVHANAATLTRPPWLARRIRQRGGADRSFRGIEARAFEALRRRFSGPIERPQPDTATRALILEALGDDLEAFTARHPAVVDSWRPRDPARRSAPPA